MEQHKSLPKIGRRVPDHDPARVLAKYPIRFLSLSSPEEVDELWNNLRQFPMLFDDFTWGNTDMFLRLLSSPDAVFYTVSDVGMIWLTGVKKGATADLFIAFWGPCTHDEKMDLLKVAGRDAFNRYNLQRIGMTCYETNTPIRKMCEEVGAHQDGLLRKALMLRGELCNVMVFSILREEFFAWAGKVEWNPDLIVTKKPLVKEEEKD